VEEAAADTIIRLARSANTQQRNQNAHTTAMKRKLEITTSRGWAIVALLNCSYSDFLDIDNGGRYGTAHAEFCMVANTFLTDVAYLLAADWIECKVLCDDGDSDCLESCSLFTVLVRRDGKATLTFDVGQIYWGRDRKTINYVSKKK
jgi:hypothetical protein